MSSLKTFKETTKTFSHVNFLVVYLSEAHPTDGWIIPLEDQPEISSHQNATERLVAANELRERMASDVGLHSKILCDTMDNRMSKLFAAHPERLVVLKGDRVIFIGGKGPFDYSIDELESFLQKQE